MKTIKLPYKASISEKRLLELMKIQSNILHISYNRFIENYSEKEVRRYLKGMNNLKIGSWLEQSAVKKAKYLAKKDKNQNKTSCFGGKNLFKKLSRGKISKEEWRRKRLFPLTSQGEGLQKGNRLFRLEFENRKIMLSINRNEKYELNIDWNYHKNYLFELQRVSDLAKAKKIPVSFELDFQYVYITFEETLIYEKLDFVGKENKVLGIDMNPNFIGWNISKFENEKQKVLNTGIYSIKNLTQKLHVSSSNSKQKNQNDKRKFELTQIAKDIVRIAKQNFCSKIVIENLNIKSKDHQKGKNFNRLSNNKWNREVFVQSLKKFSKLNNLEVIEVLPMYSSFIGNLVYSKYPDMVASSCELARRGYFKYVKEKFYPNLISREILTNKWKEAEMWMFSSWKELFDIVKKLGLKYRLSLNESQEFFRFESYKSKILII